MAYTWYRTITIDHTKVGSSTHTNFPVLVSGTYSWLATIANGGDVDNGNDIVFKDSAGTTQLDHEIVVYNPASGFVVYWVEIPSLSHTVDTVIRCYYHDASVTTDQSNRNGTWNSNYKCVLHLNSVSDLTDSTSNGNNGTNTGFTTSTGPWAGAVDSDGTAGTNKIAITNGLYEMISGAATHTISIWVNVDDRNSPAAPYIWDGNTSGGTTILELAQNADFYWGVGSAFVYSGANKLTSGGHAIANDDSWHTIHSVKTGSGNVGAMYFDAGFYNLGYVSGSISNPTAGGGFWLGAFAQQSAFRLNGKLAEFRVSDVARSADWITAEYNTANSPSTFYSVGSAVAAGGSVVPFNPLEGFVR